MHMFTDSKFMKHLNVSGKFLNDSGTLLNLQQGKHSYTLQFPSAHFGYNLSPSSYFKTQFIFFHSLYIHSFEPVCGKQQLFIYLRLSASLPKRSLQQ